MTDDLDGFRRSLQDSADAFDPPLDPAAISATGTRRHRRNLLLGGVAGAAALAVAGFGVPALLRPAAVVPAQPMSTPVATASGSSTAPAQYPALASPVSTTGWKTFSSKEYPITFSYPSGWTVDDDLGGDGKSLGKHDGCDTASCVLFVMPPKGDDTAVIELTRESVDAGVIGPGLLLDKEAKVTVLGAVPDLVAWNGSGATDGAQAVVASAKGEYGTDYSLATPSGKSFAQQLAVGGTNPLSSHPDARFGFGTNVGNIGGTYPGKGADTVVAILASARTNESFDPTEPSDGGSGAKTISNFDKMDAPGPGTISPDSSWRTLNVPAANLGVRYPSTWKVRHEASGTWWITAPSGYIIGFLTDQTPKSCDGDLVSGLSLGAVEELGATSKAGKAQGPAMLRWQNAGEYPVQVEVNLANRDRSCYQRFLGFGGSDGVYLGSADNSANPTVEELDEAVAILASAHRLS